MELTDKEFDLIEEEENKVTLTVEIELTEKDYKDVKYVAWCRHESMDKHLHRCLRMGIADMEALYYSDDDFLDNDHYEDL